jgi:aryl-alcohol dehydrogenase-like predicted oxidoreductase
MRRITLRGTDLQVSPICFGTWQFSGQWGTFDEQAAKDAVLTAFEQGVNFYDTAQAYGFGRAEGILGAAVAAIPAAERDQVVIATKGGLRPEGGGVVRDAGADWLRKGIEDSLRILDVDHIDLYQVHWPDDTTPAAETVGLLQEHIDAGKIRFAGVSNYSTEQMDAHQAEGHLATLQSPYHMLRRGLEDDILPYCLEHSIGVLAYGPLAHGLLSGRMSADTQLESTDWRASVSAFEGEGFRRNLAVVERLRELATGKGCTVPQLAVAWVLAHPAVDVAIVGARNPEQISGTAPAGDLALDEAELAQIDEILADAVPIGGLGPEGETAP